MNSNKNDQTCDETQGDYISGSPNGSVRFREQLKVARLISSARLASWGVPISALLGLLILFDDGVAWQEVSESTRWTLAIVALLGSLHYVVLNFILSEAISKANSRFFSYFRNSSFSAEDSVALLLTLPILLNMMAQVLLIKDLSAIYYFYFVASIAAILLRKFSSYAVVGVIVSLCIVLVEPAVGVLESTGPGIIDLLWIALLVNWTLYFAYKSARDTESIMDDALTQYGDIEREMLATKANLNPHLSSVSHISHELRSSLHGMLAHIQLLEHESNLSETQSDYIKMLERTTMHLRTVLNEVLDFSKIDAGHLNVSNEPVDIVQLVNDVGALFEASAQKKGLSLFVDVHPELGESKHVCTDGAKVRQIVTNLLNNSVKYTESGWVRITLDTTFKVFHEDDSESDEIRMPEIRFTVSDSGKGISPEDCERVFKPFEQAHETSLKIEGTGLGLPISRQLADLLGGTITLESVVDVGTRFTFSLPMESLELKDESLTELYEVEDQPVIQDGSSKVAETGNNEVSGTPTPINVSSVTESDTDESHNRGELRILVVDDSETNRNLMTDILDRLDCEIQTANDGYEAVQLVCSWSPHIVFMDLQMPRMNGAEATKQIRANHKIDQPLIIACTGSAFNHENEMFIEAGANRVLSKPFVIKDVAIIVEQYGATVCS